MTDALAFLKHLNLFLSGVGLMAWSTVTIGMVSAKPEDYGVSFLSRSSYKVT